MFFTPKSTIKKINQQIHDIEESLLKNQCNAEHYAALAEGCRRTLVRLRSMQKEEMAVEVKAKVVDSEKPSKLSLAAK